MRSLIGHLHACFRVPLTWEIIIQNSFKVGGGFHSSWLPIIPSLYAGFQYIHPNIFAEVSHTSEEATYLWPAISPVCL